MTDSPNPIPEGQPPITPHSGLISTDWLPGPRNETRSPVIVSFTDFRANTDDELAEIARTGLDLGKTWPVMSGAVGLWLWANPAQRRGGSISVWLGRTDLERFFLWDVHQAIVGSWRDRIEVCAQSWEDERLDADQAWLRAEKYMLAPRSEGAVM